MSINWERLALPRTAPNEIKTAAAQKSETNKLHLGNIILYLKKYRDSNLKMKK